MAYTSSDQYGNEANVAWNTTKDMTLGLVNPINWYGFVPSLYNMERGLKVPFGSDWAGIWKKTVSALESPTNKGVIRKTGVLLGGAKEALLGGSYWGEGVLNTYKETQIFEKSLQRRYLKMFDVFSEKDLGLRWWQSKGSLAKRLSKSTSSRILFNDESLFRATTDVFEEQFGKKMAGTIRVARADRWIKMAPERTQSLAGMARKLAGKGGATIGAKALKVGLMAGKMFAWWGIVSTMWDITQLIGAPIGRAAFRTLDEGFTRYQNRFMPELGGRLAMSYLSRGAATERQRAVQAISKAYINGRSAIGNEAQYAHR